MEGTELAVPLPEATAGADNAILLRYVEPRSRLHRLVSVLRVRESGFDPNTAGVQYYRPTELKYGTHRRARQRSSGKLRGPAIAPSFRTEQTETDADGSE